MYKMEFCDVNIREYIEYVREWRRMVYDENDNNISCIIDEVITESNQHTNEMKMKQTIIIIRLRYTQITITIKTQGHAHKLKMYKKC